jgi:hypothetical protein
MSEHRIEVNEDGRPRHWIVLNEHEGEDLPYLGLSHAFPSTVYGVSSLALMSPEVVEKVRDHMTEWLERVGHGSS